jgi:peptide deformylase
MLKLVKDKDPILKQLAEHWNFEKDLNSKDFEVDMVQTMVTNNGRGLAANQVGVLKRVFAIALDGQVPFCMFNPSIISYSKDSVEGEEGCLSFPDLWLKVKRYSQITAEYFDRNGNKCIIELKGMDARCFQHELDHLNGVCFTNKISPLKLALAIKKQLKRKRNG